MFRLVFGLGGQPHHPWSSIEQTPTEGNRGGNNNNKKRMWQKMDDDAQFQEEPRNPFPPTSMINLTTTHNYCLVALMLFAKSSHMHQQTLREGRRFRECKLWFIPCTTTNTTTTSQTTTTTTSITEIQTERY
jgi:hypothetical protein